MSPPKCPRYFAEAAGGRSGEQLRTDDLKFALQYITTLSGGCRATYEIWDQEEQRVTWLASRGYVAPRAW